MGYYNHFLYSRMLLPPKKWHHLKTSGFQLPATETFPPKTTRFPAAAHLVCDEDQQLTAEALEAARIAVNKCPTATSRDEWEGTNGRLPVVDVLLMSLMVGATC